MTVGSLPMWHPVGCQIDQRVDVIDAYPRLAGGPQQPGCTLDEPPRRRREACVAEKVTLQVDEQEGRSHRFIDSMR